MWDDEYDDGYGWAPYVPVAERRRNAERVAAQRRRQGQPVEPVRAPKRSRVLARTFWGQAWCDNAEAFAAWRNRLDRGKRYLRNGSVFHLEVGAGQVHALVSGNEIYRVDLKVAPLSAPAWKALVRAAQGQVDSVLDLLQGRLDEGVMQVLTRPRTGLFPAPKDVRLRCSCPDDARLCKHVAATLYGVGVRLDDRPELLFTLRGVDQAELTASGATVETLVETTSDRALEAGTAELGALFGIELEDGVSEQGAAADPAGKVRSATPPAPVLPLPRRLPREITPAQLIGWGVPRTTFQNWVGGVLERSGRRGVYLRTAETRRKILAARQRRGID